MKYSIEEIMKANELYIQEEKKLTSLYEKVKEMNLNLDLEEVKKLNYMEAKKIHSNLVGIFIDSDFDKEFRKILKDKKEKEYPQFNNVHYYPIINGMDFLSKKDKIKIDKLIKEGFISKRKREEIKYLNKKIIDFLVKHSIIEKVYIFHCNCYSDECFDEIVTQEQFEKLKRYWDKKNNGEEITIKEVEEANYGCIYIPCFYDGGYEIDTIDSFNKHLKSVEYRVIAKPDMTLDYI